MDDTTPRRGRSSNTYNAFDIIVCRGRSFEESRGAVCAMGQQPSSAEGGGFASRQTAECVRVRQETSKNLHRRLIFIVPTVSGQRDASS